MKRFLIPLAAAAALALPAGALAWDGHHGDNGDHHGMFAKVSGTGTSFGAATATATGSIVAGNDHPNGHFSVSLSTNWSAAQTKTFSKSKDDANKDNDGDDDNTTTTTATPMTVTISCAPSTATLTLSNGTTSTATLTGKTCSLTRNGATKYGFFGASTTGVRAFLREDGTTVMGLVASGSKVPEGFHLGFMLGVRSGSGDHH